MEDFKGVSMNQNSSTFGALPEFASLKPSNPEERKSGSLKLSYTSFFDEKDWLLLNSNVISQAKQVLDQVQITIRKILDEEPLWMTEKEKNKKLRTKKQQELPQIDSKPPLDLPDEFKKKIEKMGGSEITFLIQKSLYVTDLSPQHNRLSLPLNQIKNPHFLREQESLLLMKKNPALDVALIDPSLHTRNIVFGKWNFRKSSSYVLRSCWMKVADANGLRVNDVIQVWSFRVQEQLCMALVKLTPSNYLVCN